MKLEIILVILPSALSILLYLLSIFLSFSSKMELWEAGVTFGIGGREVGKILVGRSCSESVEEMSMGDVTEGVVGLELGLDKCCLIAVS